MQKCLYLVKINESFKCLENEDNLEIILDIFKKSFENKFYLKQLEFILEKIDNNEVSKKIDDYFINKRGYRKDYNSFSIYNEFLNSTEILQIRDNYITLSYNEVSLFYEYLSLILDDFIFIDLVNEKISLIYT